MVEQTEKTYVRNISCGDGGGMVWVMGAIGAAVYYLSGVATFWDGVLGILKALVWPAMLVYEALKYFQI